MAQSAIVQAYWHNLLEVGLAQVALQAAVLHTSSSQLRQRQSGSLQLILQNVHVEKLLGRLVQRKDWADARRVPPLFPSIPEA